jgi:hypothetical protein
MIGRLGTRFIRMMQQKGRKVRYASTRVSPRRAYCWASSGVKCRVLDGGIKVVPPHRSPRTERHWFGHCRAKIIVANDPKTC